MVTRVVNFIFGVIEALLAVRVILELFGASPQAPFIAWIYNVTAGLMGPFFNAFPNFYLGGVLYIDVVAILAMLVYAVIGWVVLQICWAVFASF